MFKTYRASPSTGYSPVYEELASRIDVQLQKLTQILKADVPAFDQLVKDQNVPAVVVKPPTPEALQPQP